MKNQTFVVTTLVAAMLLPAGFAIAADEAQIQERTQTRSETQEREQFYGSQLMTTQERAEHRAKLRTAKTTEEREQIRAEHHQRMQERAKERGVTLPDEPPARGGGMGPDDRMGPGGGMGSGGGMGPRGSGRGR